MDPGGSSGRIPFYVDHPRTADKPSRPIITREIEKPSSSRSAAGGAQLEASYIIPASSSSRHHVRHSSFTANDALPLRERDRLYPNSHLSVVHSPRSSKGSRDDSSDYTLSRGHHLPPPERRIRRESRSGRPTSMIDLDNHDKVYTRPERDVPSSTSSRTFEGVGRKESLRRTSHVLDSDVNHRDSLPRLYPKEERTDLRYRGLPKANITDREDYVAYPVESSRHQRPRRPTVENDAPQKLRSATNRLSDEDVDRNHKHHKHHVDPGYTFENSGKHRYIRGKYDDAEDFTKRKDLYPSRGEDRHREHDERSEGRRKEYEDKDDRIPHRHHRDRPERERLKLYEGLDKRHTDEALERERSDYDAAPTQLGLITAGGAAVAPDAANDGNRRLHRKDDTEFSFKEIHGRHIGHEPESPPERESFKTDIDEEREERRRRRRREREMEDYEREGRPHEAKLYDEETPEPLRIEAPPASDTPEKSHKLHLESGESARRRHRRHRRHRSADRETPPLSDKDDLSESDVSSDHIVRTPKVVSPPPINATEITAAKPAPKGILKQPREKFPEDSSTLREGVAPLDAAKKGIPPEARWTRINRRLVNPESLEEEGIRFEEYPDYVIVLKVLSQDEIAKLTQRTHEIRERRRLEQGSQDS